MVKNFVLLVLMLAGAGCTSVSLVDREPPQNLDNICYMLAEKPAWGDALMEAKLAYGIQPHVIMAVLRQESQFKYNARPLAEDGKGLRGGPYASSAFGFSQALDMTWAHYKKDTGRSEAKRDNFRDSVLFVGWYSDRAKRELGIRSTRDLYLAYHEGTGGFAKGTHKRKLWLAGVAEKVDALSTRYKKQSASCQQYVLGNQTFFERYFL